MLFPLSYGGVTQATPQWPASQRHDFDISRCDAVPLLVRCEYTTMRRVTTPVDDGSSGIGMFASTNLHQRIRPLRTGASTSVHPNRLR